MFVWGSIGTWQQKGKKDIRSVGLLIQAGCSFQNHLLTKRTEVQT